MTQMIEFIGVPPGYAPENIRKMWVGLMVPTLGRESAELAPHLAHFGLRDGVANAGGYRVLVRDALEALKKADKTLAFDYWCELYEPDAVLVFKAEVCREVSG